MTNSGEIFRSGSLMTPEAAREAVLSHLSFFRAIDDADQSEDWLARYEEIARALEENIVVQMRDPFERTVALTFQLVIQERLDPWNIDLRAFVKAYHRHIQKHRDIDLVAVGAIMVMAWQVLKLKSERLLEKALSDNEPEAEDPWQEDLDWLAMPEEDFSVTETVLNSGEPPIREMVRHRGKRPVTLVELVQALDQVRRESETRRLLARKRKEARQKAKRESAKAIADKMHRDDIESDIREFLAKLQRYNGEAVPLYRLYGRTRKSFLSTFFSALFLVKAGKIAIRQRNFPHGVIYVRQLRPERVPGQEVTVHARTVRLTSGPLFPMDITGGLFGPGQES